MSELLPFNNDNDSDNSNWKNNDTLEPGEIHPSTYFAIDYIKKCQKGDDWIHILYALSTLTNNRTASICLGTLQRLSDGLPVSDRYLMGLAWLLHEINPDFYESEE